MPSFRELILSMLLDVSLLYDTPEMHRLRTSSCLLQIPWHKIGTRPQGPPPRRTRITHWGRDKMTAISQTIFSNAFFRMKMFKFRLSFHWSLFPGVQLTIFQHKFRWWLGADQATSHYLSQWCLVYWRIYASLSFNEIILGLNDVHHPASQTILHL